MALINYWMKKMRRFQDDSGMSFGGVGRSPGKWEGGKENRITDKRKLYGELELWLHNVLVYGLIAQA